MCRGTPFVEFVLVPTVHEKQCVGVSCPGQTGMHYVTSRTHQMQKHKFGATCLGVLFVESVQVPTKHEK
jgi:hypothetical protein